MNVFFCGVPFLHNLSFVVPFSKKLQNFNVRESDALSSTTFMKEKG
jgi:hypothetical protein